VTRPTQASQCRKRVSQLALLSGPRLRTSGHAVRRDWIAQPKGST
jgi:hypothetical protein